MKRLYFSFKFQKIRVKFKNSIFVNKTCEIRKNAGMQNLLLI